jgi:hypothetical protein
MNEDEFGLRRTMTTGVDRTEAIRHDARHLQTFDIQEQTMNARKRFAGLRRLSVIAVAFLMTAYIPRPVLGDEIPSEIDYSTQGWVSTQASQTPLQFTGIQNGKTNGSEPFSLGSFSINAQTGVTTTYDHTPFVIDFIAPAYDRTVWGDSFATSKFYEGSFSVSGYVDGTISADGNALLNLTLNQQIMPRFDIARPTAGIYLNGLPFPLSDVKVPQSLSLHVESALDIPGAKITNMPVEVTATIVPEPGGIAVFLAGIAALGLRGRRGRR